MVVLSKEEWLLPVELKEPIVANGPGHPSKGNFEAMDVCNRLLGLKF